MTIDYISFVIPGEPVPKGRARSTIITPKALNKRAFISHYTPKKTAMFENKVGVFFRQSHCGSPAKGPISLKIKSYFKIPKSWPKKKKLAAAYEQMPVIKKPDIDNVMKSILDGLNTIAFEDDSQVYLIQAEKWYSNRPRTEVIIEGKFNEIAEDPEVRNN